MEDLPWNLIIPLLVGMLSAILFKKKETKEKDKTSNQTIRPSLNNEPIEPSGTSIRVWLFWAILALGLICFLLYWLFGNGLKM